MAKRSSYELLGILRKIDSLPSKDVKESLDGLRMKFSEWSHLTNERFAGYDARDFTSKQLKMFEDKEDISYEQYLEVKTKCKRFMELSDASNRAKIARGRRQYFLKDIQDGKYTEKELQVMSEEEVSTLEEIETLWENVRAKYDPVQEVVKSAKKAQDMLYYGTASDKLPFSIAEVKRNITQLKKATGYIDESKVLDEDCLEFEDVLVRAMEEGLRGLETLQSSTDLSVDEFIMELGLNREEINAYFKKRMEMAAEGKSNAPSIKANEGRGFKLNEEGELEIINDSKAKDLIADVFVTEKVLDGPIDVLGRADKYKMLTQYLSVRPEYSVGTKEVERLIEEIDNFGDAAVANWMIENPKRINAMQTALQENGIDIDYDSMMANLSTELESYYNDELDEDLDYIFDKDRFKKIATFLDRMNYPPREEYDESYIDEPVEKTEETVDELMQRVADNDKKIADNNERIRQALKEKIISQQQEIDAQEEEIAQLRGEKSNEK